MPIRKRGSAWQVDVRTAEGTRIRRQCETEEEARSVETSLQPNPQQRAAMRKLRRQQSARSSSTPESAKPSSKVVAISQLERLEQATSQLSAIATRAAAGRLAIVEPSTATPATYSGPSGPGFPVSPGSRR
jgi:hypothetical protein